MKIVVMDEVRKRNSRIADALGQKKNQVVSCASSGEFFEALEKASVDKIVLNFESWYRGRSIYKYFGLNKKLGATPVVFYDAPENFVNIAGRDRNEHDRVLTKPSEVEAVVAAVEQA